MLVNVLFDEESTDIDIIDVPLFVMNDIENIQKMFFNWLFNKNNDHKYWISIDGVKKYCSYRSEAFIEWLNKYYLIGTNEKAICVNTLEKNFDLDRPMIYF